MSSLYVPAMNYPKPPTRPSASLLPSKTSSPMDDSISENVLLSALTVVVLSAREKGQTLGDLQAEVLTDDMLLDMTQRRFLSEIVAKAWERMPEPVQTITKLSDTKLSDIESAA
jgi:hypothetical protein